MAATSVNHNIDSGTGLNDLTITEILNSPRSLTWKTWTDAHHVAEWWGPHEFTNRVWQWDARPGGVIHLEMKAPNGTIYPMHGVFHEVREPEFLDFTTTAMADERSSDQLQVRHNVTFEEQSGKTKLTLKSQVIKATPVTAQALAGMERGWEQSFDRLAELLAKMSCQ
jgi:uncharacterized protein YndB with AHSA1/START domain